MNLRGVVLGFCACVALVFSIGASDCDVPATSAGGVEQVKTTVAKGADGLTVEQRNVKERLAIDNKPGSIKHLYIISAYSGQVIMYSTVRGKVTSSGKRLQPATVIGGQNNGSSSNGFSTAWSGLLTTEALADDGTYGSSVEYFYWWDSKGIYHQQYVTGGMILHVSSEPIAVKSVTINLESTEK